MPNAQGDVAAVKAVPRDRRKQIFVTNVSIFFSDDLVNAQFGQSAMMRKNAMMRDNQMGTGMDEGYEDMMADLAKIYGDRYSQMGGGTEGEEKEPGFVVSVVGYTPYRDLMALLDPTGVEGQRESWGFVARLGHIDAFVDANSPFELFSKEADHFRLEKGAVDLETDFPIGIGDSETLPEEPGAPGTKARAAPTMTMSFTQGYDILVDPVTRERIDAEPQNDIYGNPKRDALGNKVLTVRDSWFKLDFKLKWEDAPEIPKPASSARRL